ncbi:MAG TPA: exodeoxyribonuclease VII large subunit [Marinospirillum sp.]|uniref:exodeoxyribonuclease VII large subunit n=1 Tax=Marinospirillum sp. TaxID=2183934 RepID=UPI002B49084E|nr:exodeoxyribonuclease VII large subunit [Marinospirillum sp.]HKM14571.1 exodeoxyribonuclease VII large subunit [Marinospirillum sp.]
MNNSLTVSQLNAQARQLLEQGLSQLWVEGEVSNFTASSAGHWYFTLKDAQAQLPCVMFTGRNGLVVRQPINGDQVQLKGSVSLYEDRGQFQLLAEAMRFSGEGDWLARLEALKKKLAAEGLFAIERKRTLPKMPLTLGVVSSLQGAALQDVLQVLQRRWPLAQVFIYPALVQGADAPASLRRAFALAQYHGNPDVLLLVRGGGNLEDLQAFNDETLARMVAASAIPVITGIGHETDFTLVDFVADQRASTPSVAAETASPDAVNLRQQLAKSAQSLQLAMMQRWRSEQQRLDYLTQRLNTQHPQQRLQQTQQKLQILVKKLQQSMTNQQQIRHLKLQQQATRLHTLSPLNTLNRGYALAETQDQQLLHSAQQVQKGDSIRIWLAQGALDCTVDTVAVAAIRSATENI